MDGENWVEICGRAFSHHQRPGSKRWFSVLLSARREPVQTTHSHSLTSHKLWIRHVEQQLFITVTASYYSVDAFRDGNIG